MQQMRLGKSSPVKRKLTCNSISIKEVFEICDQSQLVNNVLTDFMEVVVTASREILPVERQETVKKIEKPDQKESELNLLPVKAKQFVAP